MSAGVVIFRRNKEIKYLVLKYGLGHWDFVKGNIKKDEEEVAALRREATEEAGITDLQLYKDFNERINYFYKKDKELIFKRVIYYVGETKTKKITLSFEHTDYRWLPYNRALKQITYKTSKDTLVKAHTFILEKIKNKKLDEFIT